MGFIKKDNIYQITLITGNRDIILGIFSVINIELKIISK